MRFLADESCDFAVVRALRGAGYDVMTVRDANPGASDEAVIGLALAQSRILLTEDKDFGRMVFASPAGRAGVILIRFPASARRVMAETIIGLIGSHGQKISGCFVTVQPGRIRIAERIQEQ